MGEFEKGRSFLDEQIEVDLLTAGFFGEHEPEAQDWNPSISGDIDYIIPFDCLARDIQQWILSTSPKQQPALAFASALTAISTCTGRYVKARGVKGNVMFIGIAESGDGKDRPLKAVREIINAVRHPQTGHYTQMASGAALIESVSDTPSLALTIDEAGHYLAGIKSKYASVYAREIMPIITELYTSAGDAYIGKKTKGNSALQIIEPHLSFFGLSTESQLMDAVSKSDLEDGSLARFNVFFGIVDPPKNRGVDFGASNEVPKEIVDRLKSRIPGVYINERDYKSDGLEFTYEYNAAIIGIEDFFDDLARNCSDNEKAFKPAYKRLAVRSLQMAILIDQCKSVDVLRWCADICHKSTDVFIKKFNHVVSDSNQEAMVKTIERAIKESGKNGISKSGMWSKTRGIPKYMKDSILADMIESGKVFTKDVRVKGSRKESNHFFWRK